MKPGNSTQGDANQGEGDRISAHHYNEQLREFVASGKVESVAREAEEYVEHHRDEAARAERRARRSSRGTETSLEEIVAKGRTVVEQVRPIVDRALGRLRARFSHK